MRGQLVAWSSGMFLAQGAIGPKLNSQSSPTTVSRGSAGRPTGRPRRSPTGCFPGLNSRRTPIETREENACRCCANLDAKLRRDPGSNWGPSDLQSDNSPAVLSRLLRRARRFDGLGPNALSLCGERLAKFGHLETLSFVLRVGGPSPLTTKRQGGGSWTRATVSALKRLQAGRDKEGFAPCAANELNTFGRPGPKKLPRSIKAGVRGNRD
jgi:hypothetical protein